MEKGHALCNQTPLQRESQHCLNKSSPLLKAELTSNLDQVALDLLQMSLNVLRGEDATTNLFQCFITCVRRVFPDDKLEVQLLQAVVMTGDFH